MANKNTTKIPFKDLPKLIEIYTTQALACKIFYEGKPSKLAEEALKISESALSELFDRYEKVHPNRSGSLLKSAMIKLRIDEEENGKEKASENFM